MTTDQRRLVRLASAIHGQLTAAAHHTRLAAMPAHEWRRCERVADQLRRAEMRGWHLAAGLLREELRYAAGSLSSQLEALVDQLDTGRARTFKVADLYQDLLALEREFDGFSYDHRARTLSVRTEWIELEGVSLGPFEIRLDWGRLAADTSYRVIALEPNPAASREEVTHPHVKDELLCEGHGRQAIRQALAAGRLLDFFTLVAHTLGTYNDESPFVELSVWTGRACSDCGVLVNDDEWFTCQQCSAEVCEECMVSCAGCGDAHCSSCLAECRGCREAHCRLCLEPCRDCRRSVCESCLQDERCEPCHERFRSEPDEPQFPTTHDPAVHARCVGQAVVSA